MSLLPNYNDIDSNKVLNKAGLLALSSQIKTYVDDAVANIEVPESISQNDENGSELTIEDAVISNTYTDSETDEIWSTNISSGTVQLEYNDGTDTHYITLDPSTGIVFESPDNSDGTISKALSMNTSGELEWDGVPLGGSSSGSGLPVEPVADGTYMLKCVVSSGTSTCSWESVTVGGSY